MAEIIELEDQIEKVILVGVSEQDGDDAEDSVAELAELVRTAGAVVVGTLIQKRELMHPGTYVGTGKVAEIAAMISPGMEPLSALAAGATGLAAGAALAAGAFGAAGLPLFLLLMLSKILPSSVMMRHRATSIAKTSVMLVSTTVPSLASRARRARLGMDDPPLNGSSPDKGLFDDIIAQRKFFG